MSTSLQLTTKEYDRMAEKGAFDHLQSKIELIRGEIRQMNPAGPIHDDLISYLLNWSVRAAESDSVQVHAQTGLSLAELRSRPEPDLMWVRAARYRQHHPTADDVKLIIEVSDTSLQMDLIEKESLYAEARIAEYWVVDAQSKCIHVFRDPEQGVYRRRSVAKVGEFLTPMSPCAIPLDLKDLFE